MKVLTLFLSGGRTVSRRTVFPSEARSIIKRNAGVIPKREAGGGGVKVDRSKKFVENLQSLWICLVVVV